VPQDFRLTEQTEDFELDCTAEGKPLKRVDLLASVSTLQKKVLEIFGVRSYSYVFEETTSCRFRNPEMSTTFHGKGVFEVLVSD
jgi:hypothetical protein